MLNKNQDGLEHKESSLFYKYIEALNKFKPKYFLLENVRGNKKAISKISELLKVEPIYINSRLVSAQNRPRLYWTNIPNVIAPNDKNITTDDIFDYNGPLVKQNRINWLNNKSGKKSIKKGYTKINPYPKAGCITAGAHKKWNENYLYKDGIYRHLSIEELEKLQTLPKNYCTHMEYKDAYDVIGDGWTVDVIVHILRNIKEN